MNMFKNLFASALIVFGVALAAGKPEDWHWPALGGEYLVDFITFCADTRPFSYVLCGVLALALFMVRKQY